MSVTLELDPVLEDNKRCLAQAIELVSGLAPELYAAPCEIAFGASIGGHLRHNIDHYVSFLRQLGHGRVDYDQRGREARLEMDPRLASERLREILRSLEDLVVRPDQRIEVRMDCGGSRAWGGSTARRELMFLFSHSVHHYAIIAMMCRHNGHDVPRGFGVAPSTLKYQEAQAGCE